MLTNEPYCKVLPK